MLARLYKSFIYGKLFIVVQKYSVEFQNNPPYVLLQANRMIWSVSRSSQCGAGKKSRAKNSLLTK